MLALPLDGDGALHRQVYRSLREAILAGRIDPGARLPSSRDLAREAGLSRNTILQAYEQLTAEGYAATRRGAGTYVVDEIPGARALRSAPGSRTAVAQLSAHARRALDATASFGFSWALPRRGFRYDFRYGEPSYGDFPHEAWNRILGRRLRRASARRLAYGPPEGAPELREALASHLRRARGVVCEAEQIVVVRGAQQAIDLTARVLLDPGARVAIEEPHYPGFRLSLEAAGAELVSVPVDEHGLRVDALEAQADVRLAVVTPSHQFPTGVVMPAPRRMQLVAWAERTRAWLLEDDYDSEYRYDGTPIQSLQGLDAGHRVIYAGTMSKVMFPSLRVGYVVLPEPLLRPFSAVRALTDTGSPGIEQLALADFLREGHFARHLRRGRTRNAARRAALLESVDRVFGEAAEVRGDNAGLHVMLEFPGATIRDAERTRRAAAEAGVGVYPIAPCFRGEPARGGLLLGYAGLEVDDIREGVRRLGRAWNASVGR